MHTLIFKKVRFLFGSLALTFISSSHGSVLVEPFSSKGDYKISIKWQILDTDAENLQKALTTIKDKESKLHLNMIHLDSTGGSQTAALQISKIIKNNKLNTYIAPTSSCVSACSFIFISGVQRYGFGKIGVHSTTFKEDAYIDEKYISYVVENNIENVTKFVKEQRISPDFATAILNTPFWTMRYLTDTEKVNWNVNGIDRVESEILAIEIAKVRRISRSEMKSFIDRHYYECFEQVKFLKETAWECLKTKKIDESWIDKLRTKLNYFYQW